MTIDSNSTTIPHLSHKVYITDSSGIFDTFGQIKIDLAATGTGHLSLIYQVPENEDEILFHKELAVLQTRFPTVLIVHFITQHFTENSVQEQVEVTVNSDITDNITFLLIGETDFVNSVYDTINYLPITATILTTIK